MPVLDDNKRQRTIYISKRCGRLANRLVIFANLIAYAEEHGLRLRNYTFHSYCKCFESTARDFHCQYPVPDKSSWLTKFPLIGDVLIRSRLYYRVFRLLSRFQRLFGGVTLEDTGTEVLLDDPAMVDKIRPFRRIFIHGWNYRCQRLVPKHENAIRKYFRPVARHRESVNKVVQALKQRSDILVGIHIRQGDYANWQGGKHFFSTQAYVEWMREFVRQFPGQQVAFLICSNEAQDEALFSGLSYARGPGHPVSDLYSLARCDYLLGPVSTFTQWASFYGKVPLYHLTKGNRVLKLSEFKVSGLQFLE